MDGFYDIPGLTLHQVNRDGMVRSKDRMRRYVLRNGRVEYRLCKGRILKRRLGTQGYWGVGISEGGRKTTISVHRVLAQTFIPNDDPANKTFVCHNDGDKLNNSLNNLRWDTPANNSADTLKHGTRWHGERAGPSKLTKEQALEAKYGRMAASRLATRWGVTPEAIYAIRAGKNWRHL